MPPAQFETNSIQTTKKTAILKKTGSSKYHHQPIFSGCKIRNIYVHKHNKEASWLHADLFLLLVSIWFPGHHMVSMWKPYIYSVNIWNHRVSTLWNHMLSIWKPWKWHRDNRETMEFVVSRLVWSCTWGNTWKPCGFHLEITLFLPIEMMWKWHCFHLVVSHHGKDIISTHRNNMTNSKQVTETMWFPCEHHLVSTWTPCGLHMDTMCFHVDTTWLQCGHHIISRWTPHGLHVDTHHFHSLHMRSRSMETRSRLDLLLDYLPWKILIFSWFSSFPNQFSCF